MKALRYILSLGTIATLLFIGSGFAKGPEKEAIPQKAETQMVATRPTNALLFGITLTIIGAYGCRKFIKKSS